MARSKAAKGSNFVTLVIEGIAQCIVVAGDMALYCRPIQPLPTLGLRGQQLLPQGDELLPDTDFRRIIGGGLHLCPISIQCSL
jgi:hypothetical protein